MSTVTGGLEAAEQCAQGTEGESEVIQKSDTPPEALTDPKEGSCAKSDTGVSLGPRPVGSGSSIIVSPRQVPSNVLRYPNDFSARIITRQEILNDMSTFNHLFIVLFHLCNLFCTCTTTVIQHCIFFFKSIVVWVFFPPTVSASDLLLPLKNLCSFLSHSEGKSHSQVCTQCPMGIC